MEWIWERAEKNFGYKCKKSAKDKTNNWKRIGMDLGLGIQLVMIRKRTVLGQTRILDETRMDIGLTNVPGM